MHRADSLGEALILGKTEDRRRRGWQRTGWLDGTTDSTDMNLSDPRRQWRTEETGALKSPGSRRVKPSLVTERQEPTASSSARLLMDT